MKYDNWKNLLSFVLLLGFFSACWFEYWRIFCFFFCFLYFLLGWDFFLGLIFFFSFNPLFSISPARPPIAKNCQWWQNVSQRDYLDLIWTSPARVHTERGHNKGPEMDQGIGRESWALQGCSRIHHGGKVSWLLLAENNMKRILRWRLQVTWGVVARLEPGRQTEG